MEEMLTPPDLAASIETLARFWVVSRQLERDRPPGAEELKNAGIRGFVTETLCDEDLAGPALEIVERLNALIASVPKARRSSVMVGLSASSDEGGSYANTEVTWSRPETDEEWAARKADVVRRVTLQAVQLAAREQAEYERLSAKFGPPHDR